MDTDDRDFIDEKERNHFACCPTGMVGLHLLEQKKSA